MQVVKVRSRTGPTGLLKDDKGKALVERRSVVGGSATIFKESAEYDEDFCSDLEVQLEDSKGSQLETRYIESLACPGLQVCHSLNFLPNLPICMRCMHFGIS